jgi:hypothetical protein
MSAAGWGGPRKGAGRKPNPNKPKTIATPKLKTVPAEPKAEGLPAIDPRAWALMLPEIEEISKRYAVNKPRSDTPELNPFQLPAFPKKAMPPEKLRMAMDSNLTFASQQWLAGAELGGLSGEGLLFLGFTFLAELAQRPEYRVISETIADDATRRWIEFDVTGDEKKQAEERKKDPKGFDERMADPDEREKRVQQGGKTDKVKALKDDQLQLEVQQRFYEQARNDGFFGRSHLFLDIRNGQDPTDEELKTPIGDGRDEMSKGKVGRGSFKALKTIEPVWTYPLSYNAINPLRYDWYSPQQWFVMGKEIHNSRLRTFIGHPVPDMLKPAYSFGGLSLSQMAKPYVDIWLQTRQSVAQLIHSFSVMVLMTDLSTLVAPNNVGPLLARVAMFNMLRDNQGTFVVNKNTEDFKNVSASLAGLHELQSQAQEHMASVSRIPLVKLTGIQPAGLNASSEGEIKVYDDTIMAYQTRFFRPDLQRVINFEQLSLFGAVDPEITWHFEKLREITAAEKGQKEKDDADRNQKYVDMGALAPGEVRKIIIDDPELPYTGLDPEDIPEPPAEEGLLGPGTGGAAKEFEQEHASEEGLKPGQGGGANDAAGPFDEKLSKAAVQYGEGMGKSRCGRCEHFLKPDACELVEGTISRAGWCDRFEPNKQAADKAPFEESQHPRDPDGQFASSGSGGPSPAFKTKKEHASHLLQKGTTTAEMLKALGWPSISMPQMAKTLGVKLEKVKEGGVTKYKSRPMNKAEQAEFDAAAAAKKAARAAEPKKGRGRAGADPQTWSLFEFLASNGGLKPTADLQSIFGSKRGPFVPGFGPLLRPGGLPMDDALTRAKENSYILDPNDIQHTAGAENRGENTVRWQDLQDMIAEESRGRKQYRNDFAQPETEVDAEEESRHIVDALHREVTASGGTVDPALEDRVVQIMQVEGEHDVLAAYERAVMEDHDRYEAALDDRRDAGYEAEGWDVFPDAASGNGEAAAGERR